MSTSETAGQTRTARMAEQPDGIPRLRRGLRRISGTGWQLWVDAQPMAVILRQTSRGNSPRLMVMGLMKALYLALGRTNTQEVFKLCSGGEQFPARSDPHSMYEEI